MDYSTIRAARLRENLLMRQDRVRRRVALDTQRRIGEEADLRPLGAFSSSLLLALGPRRTLYCHAVRLPFFCARACATELASVPPSAFSSSAESPMMISSLTVTILNRLTLVSWADSELRARQGQNRYGAEHHFFLRDNMRVPQNVSVMRARS